MKRVSIQAVLKEIENTNAQEGEEAKKSLEIKRLNFAIKEYSRQEEYLKGLIKREQIDLSDYMNMKLAKIDTITDILSDVIAKRKEIEKENSTLQTKSSLKEGIC